MSDDTEPSQLPAVFPVMTTSRVLGIGKNQTYRMIKAGKYPVRVLEINGRHKVTRTDLLNFLDARTAPGRSGTEPRHESRGV